MAFKRPTLKQTAIIAASGVWTVFFGVVVIGFLTAWAQELGWFKDPGKKVSAALEWLIGLLTNPWFGWVAGASLASTAGFALGVSLDARSRRKGLRGPTSQETIPLRSWLHPREARRAFLEPSVIAEIDAAKTAYEAKQREADRARERIGSPSLNNIYRIATEADWEALATEASKLNNAHNQIVARADAALLQMLKDGDLVAQAFDRGKGAETAEVLDTALWRFMSINVEDATAGGSGRSFVGVVLGRPNHPI